MMLGFEEKETKGGSSDGRTKGNRAAASLTFSCCFSNVIKHLPRSSP